MKILNKHLTKNPGIVKLTIRTKTNKEFDLYIQTVDDTYRKDLGCTIHSNIKNSTLNNKDFNSEDLNIAIKEAENFIHNSYKIKRINSDYVFKIFNNNKVILSIVNHQFINNPLSN